jgi:hypothetical protein
MIAGMAASLWSALPHFNNFELKNLIESVSHQYHQPDSLRGYGIPDFYEAYKQSTGLTYPIQEGIELVTQYPNPISDHFNLLLRSDRNQKVTLMAYDLKGKILYEEAIKIERGMNKIETNEVVISSGLYFLRIQDETGKEFHLKIVKR